MKAKIVCAALPCAISLATSSAYGCDRPGTPNNVTMTATSATSVEVEWRNTTGRGMNPPGSTSSDQTQKMWFDMFFRDGSTGVIGKDLGGTGPYDVNYGSVTKRTFDGLAPSTRYCFALRARTDSGKHGCVSEITSNWGCATTLAVGQKPAPSAPKPVAPKGPASPHLGIQGQPENTLILTGGGFLSNAPVTIRVVNRALNQVWITTIGGAPITTSSSGSLSVTLKGLCKAPGDLLTFTVTDGRADPSDTVLGKLFSNAVSANCS